MPWRHYNYTISDGKSYAKHKTAPGEFHLEAVRLNGSVGLTNRYRADQRLGGRVEIESVEYMKLIKTLIVVGCVCSLLAGSAPAAEKPQKKLTCCEQAAAEGKECRRKCCVVAHKDGKSCEKCNPNKEDLKLKGSSKAQKSTAK